MTWLELDASAWRDHVRDPLALGLDGLPETAVLVVRPDGTDDLLGDAASTRAVTVVVAGSSAEVPPALAAAADLVLVERDADDLAVEVADPLAEARRLAAVVGDHPVAATSLAWLLRSELWADVDVALLAESATYSMLLASDDVRRWRAATPARPGDDGPERTRVERDGDVLHVTLTHAARRNAMDARMRDALVEALQPARWDPTLRVVLEAEGPSFSSGGDLAEFATTPDVGRAHLVRSVASAGRLLHGLGDRVEVRVQGPCVGAGVELPAFAGRVVAAVDTTFRLPEVAMGLVPGAGGTVSVPARIGRHRAAWWMLSGETIDVRTALAWGLVDGVV